MLGEIETALRRRKLQRVNSKNYFAVFLSSYRRDLFGQLKAKTIQFNVEIDAYVFSLAGHIRLEIIQQEHSTNQKLHKLASDFSELLKAFDIEN